MKGVLVASLILAPLSVSATPEAEGRLRAIISELRDNARAIEADATIAKEALAQAQQERDKAQAQIIADAARANAAISARDAHISKLTKGLQDAQEATEKAEAAESWWRWRCLILAAAILAFVGLKIFAFASKFTLPFGP